MIDVIRSSADPRVPEMLSLAHRLFPPETLEPDEELLGEIDGGAVAYLVWDEDGVEGFCRSIRLSIGTMIVHLGVAPAGQGKGIGSRLLGTIQERGTPIFAEVEEGDAMTWWLAKGARVIWASYVQPALHKDTGPVSLNLMAVGTVEDPRSVVRTIYREFYQRTEDDPLVAGVLEGDRT